MLQSSDPSVQARQARRAVLALDDGRAPRALPEEEPGWNDAFVAAIREEKDRYRGSKDLQRLLRITGELLYGRDIHWAMELVQNAEDAGARRMAFVFEPERILVWNDGQAFEAADVWAICSAGHSAKRNKIGFFGIGFKSVYKITDAPEIYSGPYALRIEGKLYPTSLPNRSPAQRGAWFVLPLREDQRAKLPSMVEALTSSDFAQVLLTLTSLTHIRIFDRTGGGLSGRFVRNSKKGDPASGWDECEIGGTWGATPLHRWRRFFYETGPVPEGISREGRSVLPGDRSIVVLARPLVAEGQPELRIHCFLPTATPSQLRWLVQADFEPSASREQLRQSSWNDWLMDEVGAALSRAIALSARRLGEAPWDLVPLGQEVSDAQQRRAYDVAIARLRETPFVQTRAGWRPPSEATWGYYPGTTEAIREADLSVATGRDVSYVREPVLGPIRATETSRAELVLEELGAESVGCRDLARLFAAQDTAFQSVRRDARWWMAALGLLAKHASDEEKTLVAASRCIPVRGGGRVQPSPPVDEHGYVVAFSRSDLSSDLNAYLGESQVFLVDEFLSPTSQRRVRGSGDDPHTAIREMLEAEPFGVAREAGPFHVVASLVIPRLNALARHDALSDDQVLQAWRLVEYVRQKWPTYVSEYRKWRSVRATDDAIARELGGQLHVVATTGTGRRLRQQLRPLTSVYVGSALLGWDAMDVALGGEDGPAFVHEIHARLLRVRVARRGGRTRGEVPTIVDLLKRLGAPVGPRVLRVPLTQVRPSAVPWTDWTDLPAGARGRVGLEEDWDSSDIARLAARWPSLGRRAQAQRGAALARAIDADWERLREPSTATAAYFYSTWRSLGPTASSWVGRLRQLPFLRSVDGPLMRPTDLVLDTPGNRLALGDPRGILGSQSLGTEALTALGVRRRPDLETVMRRLAGLRAGDGDGNPADVRAIARACYETVADELRDVSGDTLEPLRERVRSRFRGGAGRGLIYAPPPEGVSGERWWPPSRVIQADAAKWVGPYVGQLAGRYNRAAALWETLAIRRDLTTDLATDVITRDLTADPDQARALEYYGRLVAFLEQSAPVKPAPQPVPAFTTSGWQPGTSAWWSGRAWLMNAFANGIAWWQPSSRDPSSHRRAAAYLGVREASISPAGPVTVRWDIRGIGELELDVEAVWTLALRSWPRVLSEDSDPASWPAIETLEQDVQVLRPATAERLRARMTFESPAGVLTAAIEPVVVMREPRSLVIARSASDLFTPDAAAEIASLAQVQQRAWGRQLALLLAMAAHDPEGLAELAARHAVAAFQHRDFEFETDEDEDAPDVAAATRVPAKRTKVAGRGDGTGPEQGPLADPSRFKFAGVTSGQPGTPVAAGGRGGLKPPATEDADSDGEGSKPPPEPRQRFTNIDVEEAARPFIEEFELETRGCTVVRQGPGVGADYVASDGRYIEVKAFGGDAPDSFEMEATEWRAAQNPAIADRYWVYVVEHLRDGQPPLITALFNPVLDDSTSKEPTGKLKVRGWKSTRTQRVGEFAARTGPDA